MYRARECIQDDRRKVLYQVFILMRNTSKRNSFLALPFLQICHMARQASSKKLFNDHFANYLIHGN